MTTKIFSLVVLISGRGSNFKAIVEAKIPHVEIRAVISNRTDAQGLIYAKEQGIATAIISHKDYPDRLTYDTALQNLIDGYAPQLVVLAGFMRILTPQFVTHYQGRLINIHPSLLPNFKGLHTHERVLAAGVKEHGATVHFVTEELDAGPIILQGHVPVLPDDSVDTLAARVLIQEHRIYPQAIQMIMERCLQL